MQVVGTISNALRKQQLVACVYNTTVRSAATANAVK